MEKYAWMMEETDPEYFAQISHLLPPVSDVCRDLARKITAQYMCWEKEVEIHSCQKLILNFKSEMN